MRSSSKSYGTAVILSGIFGILGIHHFYLGRWVHGWIDLGLSILGFSLLLSGETVLGWSVLLVDFIHTVIVTFWLLTGSYHDGEGFLVTYPGQNLN